MKILFLSLLLMGSCSSKRDPLKLPDTLEEAVTTGYRSPENMERDQYRHPVETLSYFGIKPDMTVLEVSPGRGWYMEILAPYLTKEGQYIMALPVPDRPYFRENESHLESWRKLYPKVGEKIQVVRFSPPASIEFPKNNSVDMVLTFRNVHNWMMAKGEKQAFKAFYKVLKPGGVLGVVEHRANPTQEDPLAKSGYVREQDIIEMAIKAGFRLIGSSEVNANPKDTKNHPEGVWTLPPTLRLGADRSAKYIEMGESDRMTLKFVKPKF